MRLHRGQVDRCHLLGLFLFLLLARRLIRRRCNLYFFKDGLNRRYWVRWYEERFSLRWWLLEYIFVDNVQVSPQNCIHTISTFAISSSPIFTPFLPNWRRSGEYRRIMQVSLCTHYSICSCYVQTLLNILML